jgi:phosphoribosylaminoimidazole-succinocarboxamide synthase
VVTKRLKPVPVECIARGYIIGSGWKDYQRTGRISGITLPDGLRQAQKLAEPIFTPSTKAAVGDHDENIDFDTAVKLVGADLAEKVRDATLRLYSFARDYAAQRGILLADTKFEFGTDATSIPVRWLGMMCSVLANQKLLIWQSISPLPGIGSGNTTSNALRRSVATISR